MNQRSSKDPHDSYNKSSNPIFIVVVPFLVVLAVWNLTHNSRKHSSSHRRYLEDENPDDVQHKDMWWLGVIMSLSASFGTVRFSLKPQNSEQLERERESDSYHSPITYQTSLNQKPTYVGTRNGTPKNRTSEELGPTDS